MKNNKKEEVSFEIVKHIGVIKENLTGWTREVNIVAWNGGDPKYDIREWDPNHEHMSKGITLTKEEAETVASLLSREKNLKKESHER